MGVTTIYRLAEETQRLIEGGNPSVAAKVHINELKLSVGQVANALLKVDYWKTNMKIGEVIPNGSVLALYENIPVKTVKNRCECRLPIKPLKLPRNIGVFSIFDENCEFIPIEIGQAHLIQSQPLVSKLMDTGYECFGDRIVFTDDISSAEEDEQKTVSMRLAIMDITQYDDWTPLPILPEMEWEIKKEVYKLYIGQIIPDKVVDPGRAEQKGVPLNQQSQG